MNTFAFFRKNQATWKVHASLDCTPLRDSARQTASHQRSLVPKTIPEKIIQTLNSVDETIQYSKYVCYITESMIPCPVSFLQSSFPPPTKSLIYGTRRTEINRLVRFRLNS